MQPINSKKMPLTFDTIEPGSGLAAALKKSRSDIIGEISASNQTGPGLCVTILLPVKDDKQSTKYEARNTKQTANDNE